MDFIGLQSPPAHRPLGTVPPNTPLRHASPSPTQATDRRECSMGTPPDRRPGAPSRDRPTTPCTTNQKLIPGWRAVCRPGGWAGQLPGGGPAGVHPAAGGPVSESWDCPPASATYGAWRGQNRPCTSPPTPRILAGTAAHRPPGNHHLRAASASPAIAAGPDPFRVRAGSPPVRGAPRSLWRNPPPPGRRYTVRGRG